MSREFPGGAVYWTKGRAKEYCELAVNLYDGCGHQCVYCYGANVMHKKHEEFFRDGVPRDNIVNRIRKDAILMEHNQNFGPVLLCFVTDPYQPVEKEYCITRHSIQILNEHGIGVHILTKAGALAQRDFDLLGPKDAFATTLTCYDAVNSEKWEPYAGRPNERILNLREAHGRGIPTWVSCEPVIYPKQTLYLIELTAEWVDEFKVGTMNYHPHGWSIDWKRFGNDAVELLERIGKKYYIKKDLRRFMGIE